jgi:hypothetical protein
MKGTSIFLIIAFFASLFAQQNVIYFVDDDEERVYLVTLNVCASSHDALSQDTDTSGVSECMFWIEPHARISRYLISASVGYNSLPASEKYHPPRFSV